MTERGKEGGIFFFEKQFHGTSISRAVRVMEFMVQQHVSRHVPSVQYPCMYEYRCDERLKTKAEGSTHLGYTGLCRGREDLKIETRLIDERFTSVMGEDKICVYMKR